MKNIYKLHTQPETLLGYNQVIPNQLHELMDERIQSFEEWGEFDPIQGINVQDLFKSLSKRHKALEGMIIEWIKNEGDIEVAHFYAMYTIKGRWEEVEHLLMNPKDSSIFARYITQLVRERIPEAEDYISQHADTAYAYASNVINGRFPSGEKAIMKDPVIAREYSSMLNK